MELSRKQVNEIISQVKALEAQAEGLEQQAAHLKKRSYKLRELIGVVSTAAKPRSVTAQLSPDLQALQGKVLHRMYRGKR